MSDTSGSTPQPHELAAQKSKNANVSPTRKSDDVGPVVTKSGSVDSDPAAAPAAGNKPRSGNKSKCKSSESETFRTARSHSPYSTGYGGSTTPRGDPAVYYASAYNRVSHGDRGDGFRGRFSDDTSTQASESYGDGACSEPRTTNRRSRAPSPPHGGLEDVSDAAETRGYTPRDVSNSRLLRDNSHMRDSPVRRTGPTRRSRPAVNADEDYDDNGFAAPSETESDVFVPQVKITSRRAVRAGRVEKSRGEGRRAEKQPMYTTDDLIKPRDRSTTRRPLPSEPPKKKKGPSAEEDAYFNNIGRNLEDSRYSGAEMPWGVNKQPPAVPQDEVSDAALLKRGLKRGQGDKVAKRGYGANDPENIAIVNMKEQDNLSFEQIANILNTKRVEAGKNPNLTVTGCNGRYNRTAPLLFAAQGQEFVPLSQRKGHGKHGGSLQDQAVFNNDTDIELVNCVKEVDSRKWYSVASRFTERTGLPMNAKAAAIRFGML